jgi:hypothetical protein
VLQEKNALILAINVKTHFKRFPETALAMQKKKFLKKDKLYNEVF